MVLEQYAYVAEIVGVVLVAVTLMFLTLQIRQNTQQMRADSVRAATDRYSTALSNILCDPEKLRIFKHGLSDYDGISADDQAHFHGIMAAGVFSSFITIYGLYKSGVLELDHFRMWERDLVMIIKSPGGAAWWNFEKSLVGPIPVVAHIDRVANEVYRHEKPVTEVIPWIRQS